MYLFVFCKLAVLNIYKLTQSVSVHLSCHCQLCHSLLISFSVHN